MRATATEGSAVVILEFEAGFDADQELLDVREKVDTVKAELPDDTDEPVVQEVNVALFPVLVVNLHGNVPERTLFTLARDLRDTLEALPGVLDAEIIGNREELLEIIVDPVAIESYNLNYEDLLSFVSRNNRLVAAGALTFENALALVSKRGELMSTLGRGGMLASSAMPAAPRSSGYRLPSWKDSW